MAKVRPIPRTNTLILMYVDTQNITAHNVDDFVLLTDSNGDFADRNGPNIGDFTSAVKKGGNVTWVGVATNPADVPNQYVIIYQIKNINGDSNIPGLTQLKNEPSQPGTHMSAKIIPNTTVVDIDYTITFHVHTIDDSGNDTAQEFSIDPKLKIH